MLEQQAGIQAKTAAKRRKSSNAGPYVDGDTSNRVRVFSTVDLTPVTLVTETLDKKDRMMLEHRQESKPKPQLSHENPAMRGRMSTGTPPTEFEFSPLLISPLGTLVTERLDKKDCMVLEQQAGIQAKNAAEPRKSSNAGPYVDGRFERGMRLVGKASIRLSR
jgi:hypothetical protein